jgi:alanyl-tRNA synthetase
MNSQEIRKKFLNFYNKEKQHVIMPSYSLLPPSKSNLLFTNSGMNQFLPIFLGIKDPIFKRVVNTQKCIRAGGKHNDLSQVGYDYHHHTFFEMLGNWSFGDYFKRESIQWSWEFLTKVCKFPKDRIYVTVYKPENNIKKIQEGLKKIQFDQESYEIWKEIFLKENINPLKHICFKNHSENFWKMGDSGPCGTCSEIFFDLTRNKSIKKKKIGKNCLECIEIWNLVFIEYNLNESGKLNKLPLKNVDTGMGLERLSGVINSTNNFSYFNGYSSNYNSDLFKKIFDKIKEISFENIQYESTLPSSLSNLSKQEKIDVSYRIVADHIRSLTFAISDGILPKNTQSGYVIRKILRRTLLYSKHLKLPKDFLILLSKIVIQNLDNVFPNLYKNRKLIYKTLEQEKYNFERTLRKGINKLDEIYFKKKRVSSLDIFTLKDTYGLPIELTKIYLKEKGLDINFSKVKNYIHKQKKLSLKSSETNNSKNLLSILNKRFSELETKFVGYNINLINNFKSKIIGSLFYKNKYFIVFNKSIFYPGGGGQDCDKGKILIKNFSKLEKNNQDKNLKYVTLNVNRVFEIKNGVIIHEIKYFPLNFNLNYFNKVKNVILNINIKRRTAMQKNHTSVHLLHWALIKNIKSKVEKCGSYINKDYLRFDFKYLENTKSLNILKIETLINKIILKGLKIKEKINDSKNINKISLLRSQNIFLNKNFRIIREIKIEKISKEFCRGTHVNKTSDIELFKIISYSSIGNNIKRIKAITGTKNILKFINDNINILSNLSKIFSCKFKKLNFFIKKNLNEKNNLKKKINCFKKKKIEQLVINCFKNIKKINNNFWIIQNLESEYSTSIKKIYSLIIKKSPSIGVILISKLKKVEKNIFLIKFPKNFQKNILKFNNFISYITKISNIKHISNNKIYNKLFISNFNGNKEKLGAVYYNLIKILS